MKHSLSGKNTFELLGSRIEMLPNIRLWGAQLLRGKNSDVWTLKFNLSLPWKEHSSNYTFLFWDINILTFLKIAKTSWIIDAKLSCTKGLCKLWVYSPASAIFASVVTVLESFEAILMYFEACGRSLLWNWLLKLILTENLFKIASKLTSIVTILANIAIAGDHIFQVVAQYSWVLPQYLQVLSQYLRVLSRWIHPRSQPHLSYLNSFSF